MLAIVPPSVIAAAAHRNNWCWLGVMGDISRHTALIMSQPPTWQWDGQPHDNILSYCSDAVRSFNPLVSMGLLLSPYVAVCIHCTIVTTCPPLNSNLNTERFKFHSDEFLRCSIIEYQNLHMCIARFHVILRGTKWKIRIFVCRRVHLATDVSMRLLMSLCAFIVLVSQPVFHWPLIWIQIILNPNGWVS